MAARECSIPLRCHAVVEISPSLSQRLGRSDDHIHVAGGNLHSFSTESSLSGPAEETFWGDIGRTVRIVHVFDVDHGPLSWHLRLMLVFLLLLPDHA